MLIRNPIKFLKATRPNGDLPEIAAFHQRMVDYCEQPGPLSTHDQFEQECG